MTPESLDHLVDNRLSADWQVVAVRIAEEEVKPLYL
ncbi:hypothetical protein NAP1_08827 [Erythrobacter sp. NAP1]|nr:hypothetical protein NAP1_08827 [Erythrobacter sp. NAP1]